ncbi:MAG: Mut7-C RNAse domain-containing protein [Myxococcota bacterium]|nr:Mut7-C RNAse domain-containing protein [Myxococcota bacterium]
MGVPCPSCGRSYDVSLFSFGRTIWCRCGSRVGLEARLAAPAASAEKRFIADAMLGRLARWLRLLGFDCAYESGIPDEELIRRGVEEGRTILSRDRRLPEEWRVEGIYLVRSEGFREQLAEVVRHFGLSRELRILTRCSECNRRLAGVSAAQVASRVPARVLETRHEFRECPRCRRVYWQGSHTERIRRVVERLLPFSDPGN